MKTPILSIRKGIVTNGTFSLSIPTMNIHEGEMVAIIGPNGAGKSSFIEAIFGFSPNVEGDIDVLGVGPFHPGWSESMKKRVGLQLQKVNYPHNMKVFEIIQLHDALYETHDSRLLIDLGIDELQKKAYRNLSRGEKQRVDLYVALGHPSDLLVLDEPSTGLDYRYEVTFKRLLKERRLSYPTCAILLASHKEEEVAIADRIAWLKDGVLQRTSSGEDILRDELGEIKIELKGPPHAVDSLIESLNRFESEVKRSIRPKNDLLQLFGSRTLEGAVCHMPITTQFTSSRVTELVLGDLMDLITESKHVG